MKLLLLASLAVMTAQAGKKKDKKAKKDKDGSSETAAAEVVTGQFPDDKASQSFMKALTAMTVEDFAAVDGGGATVVLTRLNFLADNTWTADGYTEALDERMECVEHGSWSMEPATSAKEATINWTIVETDCIGRDNGTENRALITIEGDDIEVAFR